MKIVWNRTSPEGIKTSDDRSVSDRGGTVNPRTEAMKIAEQLVRDECEGSVRVLDDNNGDKQLYAVHVKKCTEFNISEES